MPHGIGFVVKEILQHLISIQPLLNVLYVRLILYIIRLQHLQKKDYHLTYPHFSFFLSAEENTQEPREGIEIEKIY